MRRTTPPPGWLSAEMMPCSSFSVPCPGLRGPAHEEGRAPRELSHALSSITHCGLHASLLVTHLPLGCTHCACPLALLAVALCVLLAVVGRVRAEAPLVPEAAGLFK